jgi:tRNA (guanosine-2'-O-)-methyltransferase
MVSIKEQIEYLSDFATPNRVATFRKVAALRQRYISVFLENIYQGHNASAVLRTCDCFGVQNIHACETTNLFDPNPEISMGAENWLSLKKWTVGSAESLSALGQAGYRRVATIPGEKAVSLWDFDLEKGPVMLMFGTEQTGLSKEALDMADEFLAIPMQGFTESFNISVSAGIILSSLLHRLRTSDIQWALPEEEQDALLLNWLRKSVKSSEKILASRFGDAILPG